MPELVSILIPAYNAEKWIKDTIKSALEQTWRNKEIIIIDDGSKDNTYEVAKKFSSKTVKVMTQENSGACCTRNKALSFAQGDYIQWLDADDLLAPDKISLQLANKESGLSNKILLSSSFGSFFYRPQKAKFEKSLLWQDLSPVDWMLTKFNNSIWMNPAVWLVSRKLTEIAGTWDERLSLDDDGEYFCRVVAASQMTEFIHSVKSYYRQVNLSSVSRQKSEKACKSLLLSLKLCFKHLLSLEDSERTRKACFNYLQIWYYYFFPEKHELLIEVNDLAFKLNGKVLHPRLPKKYEIIMKFIGWEATKNIMFNWERAKLIGLSNWDRILSIIDNNKFQ